MATTHPKRRILNTGSLSPEDYEAAVRPFEEALGALNEHNFDANALKNTELDGDFAPGALCRTAYTDSGISDDVPAALALGYNGPWLANTSSAIEVFALANAQLVVETETWAPIEGTLVTVNTDACRLCVTVGGQGAGYKWENNVRCYKFGVFVNGALVSESVIGGQDESTEAPNMDQGVGWVALPFDFEVTVPVPRGRHTVYAAIWVQPLQGDNLTATSDALGAWILYADCHVLERAR